MCQRIPRKEDKRRKQDPKWNRGISLAYKVYSKYFHMGGLPLVFVQYSRYRSTIQYLDWYGRFNRGLALSWTQHMVKVVTQCRLLQKGLVFGHAFQRARAPLIVPALNTQAVIRLRRKKEHAQRGLLQNPSGHLFGCCFWLPANSLHWALVAGPLMASDWL